MFLSKTNLIFRPDIEGLRGLAVLMVMLYHFNMPFVTGGYIGVDIFFVISGFLITSIINQGLEQENFSLAYFYRKRIQRLMPALIFTCIIAFLFFSFVLIPDDYVLFLQSIREIFLFSSNNFFLKETLDYFAPFSDSMPLLHAWTLSLEWQFYFIFPFILIFFNKLFKKRAVFLFVLIVTFFFIAISIVETLSDSGAYFSFHTRFFEFSIGAVTAFVRFSASDKKRLMVQVFCIVGLLFLSIFYVEQTPFPGVNALWVCLLTACFIMVGGGSKVLFHSSVLWVGKISYSTYLLHWLFVAGFYHLGYELDGLLFIPLTLITLGFAYLSYRFIEEPFRRMDVSLLKVMIVYVLVPIVAIMAIIYYAKKHDGIPERLGGVYSHIFSELKESGSLQREKCHTFDKVDMERCSFGELSSEQTGLLVGDSHASHYWSFIDVLAKDASVKIYGRTGSSCFVSPGVVQYKRGEIKEGCRSYVKQVEELLEANNYDFVIISERWIGYGEAITIVDEHGVEVKVGLQQALGNMIDLIISKNIKPIIILPIAENGQESGRCFLRNIKYRDEARSCEIIRGEFAKDKFEYVSEMFESLQARYKELTLIDPKLVQCQGDVCRISAGGVPFYSDVNHINDYAAKWLGNKYIKQQGNPLIESGD